MNLLVLTLLFILCYLSNASGEYRIPTTTVYDLNVPGASPIRIMEAESMWKKLKPPSPTIKQHRSLSTSTSTTNLGDPLVDEDAEYNSHSALKDFLNKYAANLKKDNVADNPLESKDGKDKKSWSLLNLRKHNHPNEDKKGWITMDPIPWSVSKISKWQSKPNTKPERPWNQSPSNSDPWESYDGNYDGFKDQEPPRQPWVKPQQNTHQYQRPSSTDTDKYQIYYVNDDRPNVRPIFPKPSASYGQTVHLQANHNSYKRNPIVVNDRFKEIEDDCNKNEEDIGIITDGEPPNFPSNGFEINRRTGTELYTSTHPFMKDGGWVLLSTTKGYKVPKAKQRSLNINAGSVGSHRSVRLTVLPPLNDGKVNMTTSHGGLLQVDSTFETVEQARKNYVKMQSMKNKPKRPRPIRVVKRKTPIKEITSSTLATIPRDTGPDSSAVLAAVGAGMVPATMAMLVPFAMHGRRRKKRNIFTTSFPFNVKEVTLQRYL